MHKFASRKCTNASGSKRHAEQWANCNRHLLDGSILLINGRQERGQDVLADGEIIELVSLHSLTERKGTSEGGEEDEKGRRGGREGKHANRITARL